MATYGWMRVVANGNEVRGDSTVTSEEREGTIEVVELTHDIRIAADASAGSSTGTRQHYPLRVVARIDRATPVMYQALAQNMPCEVTIRYWRPDPAGTGASVEYFAIALLGARVNGVKMCFPNALEEDTASIPETVEYTFIYESITWTHVDGSIEYQDRWQSDRPA